MRLLTIIATLLLLPLAAAARPDVAPGWTLAAVTGPSPFHGVHGLTVTRSGRLLAGSVVGATLYEVDRATGAVTIAEPPPIGMADDVEEGPDGTLAWTAFLQGRVYARRPDGTLLILAEGLPGTNSLAWTDDGRLFMSQVFAGDALWELDPTGSAPPRLVMKDMGGLNGFDFGPDGLLYGPLWFKGQIVRIDVDTGAMETVAQGFTTPAAVNFAPDGRLYAIDTANGEVVRIGIETGARHVVTTLKPALDNLAFAPDGTLYVSNMADNAIIEVDPQTGAARPLVEGPLAVAADIAMAPDGHTLHVADVFAIRSVDTQTGAIREIARVFAQEMDYPTGIGAGHDRIALAGLTAGAVQLLDAQTGVSQALNHGFATPGDALPLADGAVLVSEYARGAVVRLEEGAWDRPVTIADKMNGPAMLAEGPEGAIYVSETEGGRLLRLDGGGGFEVIAEDLANPEGFAFLPDGRIAVAEAAAARISTLDPATGTRAVIAKNLPFGIVPDEGPTLFMPTGVAADAQGRIYFSSEHEARIYRLSPEQPQ